MPRKKFPQIWRAPEKPVEKPYPHQKLSPLVKLVRKDVRNPATGKMESVLVKVVAARWARGAARQHEKLGFHRKPSTKGRFK